MIGSIVILPWTWYLHGTGRNYNGVVTRHLTDEKGTQRIRVNWTSAPPLIRPIFRPIAIPAQRIQPRRSPAHTEVSFEKRHNQKQFPFDNTGGILYCWLNNKFPESDVQTAVDPLVGPKGVPKQQGGPAGPRARLPPLWGDRSHDEGLVKALLGHTSRCFIVCSCLKMLWLGCHVVAAFVICVHNGFCKGEIVRQIPSGAHPSSNRWQLK